jgi:DNA-binding transcriptional regulator/RsmH inhibitor MraZ
MDLQVVLNKKGKKTVVIVPIADWEEIQKRLNTEKFFDELASSFKAIKSDIEGSSTLNNARDLLNGHLSQIHTRV